MSREPMSIGEYFTRRDEKDEGFPISMPELTADQLIDRYLVLRDYCDAQTKALTEYLKPCRDEMQQIGAQVHQKLIELGGDKPKLATGSGTAFLTTTKNPKVTDRDEYIKWCLQHWQTFGNAMLQIAAPQVTAVNEYMDAHDGQLPPHVQLNPNTTVTIRKS